jgi:hypothetical protein
MNAIRTLAAIVALFTMLAAGIALAQNEESDSNMGQGMMGGQGDAMMGHGMMGGPGMGHGDSMMGRGMMGEGGYPMMGRMQGMGRRGGALAMCGKMTAHVEGRLAFLKAELELTPEQESLWNAYATAVRDNAKSMTSRCAALMDQSKDKTGLLNRLNANTQFMQSRTDGLLKIVEALKPLYAALADAQKKTADQLIKSSTGFM